MCIVVSPVTPPPLVFSLVSLCCLFMLFLTSWYWPCFLWSRQLLSNLLFMYLALSDTCASTPACLTLIIGFPLKKSPVFHTLCNWVLSPLSPPSQTVTDENNGRSKFLFEKRRGEGWEKGNKQWMWDGGEMEGVRDRLRDRERKRGGKRKATRGCRRCVSPVACTTEAPAGSHPIYSSVYCPLLPCLAHIPYQDWTQPSEIRMRCGRVAHLQLRTSLLGLS